MDKIPIRTKSGLLGLNQLTRFECGYESIVFKAA